MTRAELLTVISFVRRTRGPAVDCLGLRAEDPIWNMVLYLMERSLHNRLVTVTSLAAAAEIPYTTALRRIEEMFAHGLLLREPRGRSGRSHAIVPSEALRARFLDYAARIKAQVAATVGQSPTGEGGFYFGAAYGQARIIAPPSSASAPLVEIDRLRLLLKNQPVFLSLARLRPTLEALLRTPLALRIRDYDNLLAEVIENALQPSSAYDIVAVPYPWLGELVARGALLPLDELLEQDGGATALDFYPVAWDAARFRDRQYAMPFEVAAELLCYREDLLAAAGLDPPGSLDQLIAVGRRLTDPARGVYGVAWCGRRGTPLAQTYLHLLADLDQPPLSFERYQGYVDLHDLTPETLRPCFDTDAARAAAEHLLRLKEISPPEILDMAWDERLHAYITGRVAMAYNWSIRLGDLEANPGSPARGRTGVAPHPSGASKPGHSPLGGFALAIPSNVEPARRRQVWRAVRWLTSPEIGKTLAMNGACCSPRISVGADPEVVGASGIIRTVDALARSELVQRWCNPPVPQFSAIQAIIGAELHDMLAGAKSPEAALAEMQRAAERQLRSV